MPLLVSVTNSLNNNCQFVRSEQLDRLDVDDCSQITVSSCHETSKWCRSWILYFSCKYIKKFHDLGCFPININLSRPDEGNGIERTFQENDAKWHKSCYTLFNTTKRNWERKKDEVMSDFILPLITQITPVGFQSIFMICAWCLKFVQTWGKNLSKGHSQ